MRARSTIGLALFCGIACRPDLQSNGSIVQSPRILAIKGEPPESTPGRAVRYQPLVALPAANAEPPAFDWSFCDAPKPLTENDVVSAQCFSGPDRTPIVVASPSTVTATTPLEACRRFGPDPPPGMFRPRDPDGTGGYFQPLIVSRADEEVVALERITCNLARATPDVAVDFRMRYRPNQNPVLTGLRALVNGTSVAFDRLPPGRTLELEASWSPDSKESFVVYDIASGTLVEQEETFTWSWFSSGGDLDVARSAGPTNTWTTPGVGPATLWLILRDSRGGTDFVSQAATVVP